MLQPGLTDGSSNILPGVCPLLLSSWDRKSDTFDHRFMRPEVVAELARWAGETPQAWEKEVAARKRYLDTLRESGATSITATRSALELYRG
jgi:hypothetical protein